MARILNLVIIIFEIIAFSKSINWHGIRKSFIFYTQISNFITLISSLLLVVFGQMEMVEVARYLSVCMLVMTFFVTAAILVPMSGKLKELLLSGSGLYHHLLVPIISALSYIFFEVGVPFYWIWLPVLVTLVYGLIMLRLNYLGLVQGPYPFFMIKSNGIKATVIWMIALMIVISLFSGLVGYL